MEPLCCLPETNMLHANTINATEFTVNDLFPSSFFF